MFVFIIVFMSHLCTKSVTPITLRLKKHHVTELEHENRWQNQTLTKNAMFKTVCPTRVDSTLHFFSCHEPEIECKAIPHQV